MKKNFLKKLFTIFLSLNFIFSIVFSAFIFADMSNLELESSSYNIYPKGYKFVFKTQQMADCIKKICINDTELKETNSSYNLNDGEFFRKESGYHEKSIIINNTLKKEDKVKFVTEKNSFVFVVENPVSYTNIFKNKIGEVITNDDNKNLINDKEINEKVDISLKGSSSSSPFEPYCVTLTPKSDLEKIDGVEVGAEKFDKVSSKISTFGKKYFIDTDKIYLGEKIKDGSVIVFKSKEKILYKFQKISDIEYKKIESNTFTDKELHIRLVGHFESAIVNQKKYDAISAATGSSSSNKNSNVTVQIAESVKGEQPKDSDWKLVKEAKDINLAKSTVSIDNENMGMKPIYNVIDSSVTLRGIPTKEGKYKISIDAVDSLGRNAKSNELEFNVYDIEKVKLSDQLVREKFNILKSKDKYEWDMDPWNIKLFASSNPNEESFVTVPSELKLWHGSRESGTYGVLGYAVNQNDKPHQTLIIENGTSLTLRNMKIFSSVNILVKNGGKLNFYDSSLYGTITVENGGKFQMNYDEYNKKYLTGSSINGQLILKDGAVLEDSIIYSNANNLTDSNVARLIETPVIKVEGKVTINGRVYVRGDESPTGKSPTTGKLYTGQPAMELSEGATLNIPKNSELGLYGGGKNATTTIGGDALILNVGSKVEGEGKLIAVGGDGQLIGAGGNGVSGIGQINVKEAFLQGGNNYNTVSEAGKAITENIKISKDTVGYAKDGKHNPTQEEKDNSPYWIGVKAPGVDTTIINPLKISSTENAPKIIKEIRYNLISKVENGSARVIFKVNENIVTDAVSGNLVKFEITDISDNKEVSSIKLNGKELSTDFFVVKDTDINIEVILKDKDTQNIRVLTDNKYGVKVKTDKFQKDIKLVVEKVFSSNKNLSNFYTDIYDVFFVDKDGKTVNMPNKEYEVIIPKNREVKNIFYLKDNVSALEKVNILAQNEREVTFKVNHFSKYVLNYGEKDKNKFSDKYVVEKNSSVKKIKKPNNKFTEDIKEITFKNDNYKNFENKFEKKNVDKANFTEKKLPKTSLSVSCSAITILASGIFGIVSFKNRYK